MGSCCARRQVVVNLACEDASCADVLPVCRRGRDDDNGANMASPMVQRIPSTPYMTETHYYNKSTCAWEERTPMTSFRPDCQVALPQTPSGSSSAASSAAWSRFKTQFDAVGAAGASKTQFDCHRSCSWCFRIGSCQLPLIDRASCH